VARRDHERRFAGPKRLEVLLDRFFAHCFTIGHLLNDSTALQLLPAGLEPAGFQILDCGFQCGLLLSLRLEQFHIPDRARPFENVQGIPAFD
jgi:hypothetical protein